MVIDEKFVCSFALHNHYSTPFFRYNSIELLFFRFRSNLFREKNTSLQRNVICCRDLFFIYFANCKIYIVRLKPISPILSANSNPAVPIPASSFLSLFELIVSFIDIAMQYFFYQQNADLEDASAPPPLTRVSVISLQQFCSSIEGTQRTTSSSKRANSNDEEESSRCA